MDSRIKMYAWLGVMLFLTACAPALSETGNGNGSLSSTVSETDAGGAGRGDAGNGASDPATVRPVEELAQALQARGFEVSMAEQIEQPFFVVPAQILLVNGESVQLFLFEDADASRTAADQVAPDGFSIGTTMVTWVAPPHFYRSGALIAIYPGNSEAIMIALKEEMGQPFAGEKRAEVGEEFPEPPPAYLSIDGAVQQSGIGSYCWGSVGEPGVCVDKIGQPTPQVPLPAPTMALLQFALAEGKTPEEINLSVRSVDAADAMDETIGGWQWWPMQEPGVPFTLPAQEDPQIELTFSPGLNLLSLFVRYAEQGDVSYGFLVDANGLASQDDSLLDLNPDAAAFAADQGISLEEASWRLSQQDSIGNTQAQLMADMPTTFAGLWVEHEPAYRIVIALTEGNEKSIQPYLEGKAWAEQAEVVVVEHSLLELQADQQAAGQIVRNVGASAITTVDIAHNRVEVIVGNPALFHAAVSESGLTLPTSVEVVAARMDAPPPDTNQGVLLEATASDGRTIYLPTQGPVSIAMEALIEGILVEANGCLRLVEAGSATGFLVIWPFGADIRVASERIEVLDEQVRPVARVGDRLRASGGAIESSQGIEGMDERTPGLPIEGCPGPYWVVGDLLQSVD